MPAANRHLPVVETRRLPLHITNFLARETNSQAMSRLVLTDGSLLFIVQIQHERHNAGNGTQGPKDRQNHLRNMYRLPRKVFPRELPTSLHSAQHGMAGNRLLPHTVYKGGKNSTWTVGFHLKSIIQDSADLSNKLGAKDRAAILRLPCLYFSSDSASWWSGSTSGNTRPGWSPGTWRT